MVYYCCPNSESQVVMTDPAYRTIGGTLERQIIARLEGGSLEPVLVDSFLIDSDNDDIEESCIVPSDFKRFEVKAVWAHICRKKKTTISCAVD